MHTETPLGHRLNERHERTNKPTNQNNKQTRLITIPGEDYDDDDDDNDDHSLTHCCAAVGRSALHVDRSSARAHASAAVSPVSRTI